ncbi:MAG UNVERIFIED_CONTAM: hypothetical protein LVQ98_05145 [Rickettsiaceae bacterium]|jgi:two-component system osmolarity sensor histidine kinase EnvZ
MKVISSIYKFLIPRTLASRFILIITVPVILVQLLAIYIFYERHWSNILYSNSKTIAAEVNLVADLYNKHGIEIAQQYANMLSMRLYYTKFSKAPRKIEEVNPILYVLSDVLKLVTKNKSSVRLIKNESEIQISYKISNGTLFFIRPIKHLINPTAYIFTIWMIFLTLLLLTVALIFSKNQIKSILELAKAADAFGAGVK